MRVLHAINRVYARGYHDVSVSGLANVPRTGPLIVISNHVSSLDPLLIQAVVHRPIHWMIAKEFYELPLLKPLFQRINLIPVSRDGKDSTALRTALRTLHAGRVVGVFPEGKISTNGQLLPFQTGVAMIALRSGVPVLPVYQTGSTSRAPSMTGAILLPQQVTVRFGKMINFLGPKDQLPSQQIATGMLETAISELRPDQDRTFI